MSFQNGNVAFRRMHIAGNMGPDVADQLAKRGMDLTTPKTAFGWASWQSTLIPLADGRDAICAGYLRANLVKCKPAVQARYRRERIKSAMLHAAVDAGVPVKMLSKRDRKEIRNAVDEELFKASTPAIRAIEFAMRPGDNWLLASCMSLAEQDFLVNFFREATGGSLHAVTLPVWASLKGIQLPDFPEWDFVNDGPSDDGGSMADDFLTWLWAVGQAEGGWLKADGKPITCALDGPITLHGCDGDKGPRTVMLRAGTPTLGDELMAALRAGKKITSAKLMIEAQGKAFMGMVDGTFGFRAVKLPPSVAATEADAFQERVVDMRIWTETIYSMVETFAQTRMDAGKWGEFTRGVAEGLGRKTGSGVGGRGSKAQSKERRGKA